MMINDTSLRLGRLDDGRTVVLLPTAEAALDVAAAIHAKVPHSDFLATILGPDARGSWVGLIEAWEQTEDQLRHLLQAAADEGSFLTGPADSLSLGPPLPATDCRIFALGGNFAQHVKHGAKTLFGEESDMYRDPVGTRKAEGPWGFLTLPDTVIGPDADVAPPAGLTKIDYEGEVAVVLAGGGRDLAAEDVSIWGYTAWNDFSLRDAALGTGEKFDRGVLSWTLQKNFDTGSSCGPWMVVGDVAENVQKLPIVLRVNGETRQDGGTDDMIFSFAETAEHLSRFLTLRGGDLVASGTPAGTALESGFDGPYLRDGDVTEVEVEGVGGVLRNTVRVRPRGR